MDLGHNCQSFGRSFSQGLYPGLFGNPPLPGEAISFQAAGNAGPSLGAPDAHSMPAYPEASKGGGQ